MQIKITKVRKASGFGGGRGSDLTRQPGQYAVIGIDGGHEFQLGLISARAHQAFERPTWEYTATRPSGRLVIDDVFRGPTEVSSRRFRTLARARAALPELLAKKV